MARAKRYYIAYGSNLNVRQMRYRCPGAKIVGTAYIPGYELLFKGSKTGSYLTIEKKEGAEVPVGVWEVTPSDEAALDRYEGFPTFYYKTDMELEVTGLDEIVRKKKVFVYIMHEDRQIGIPTDWYVYTCLEGYKSFGFGARYLADALRRSREVAG